MMVSRSAGRMTRSSRAFLEGLGVPGVDAVGALAQVAGECVASMPCADDPYDHEHPAPKLYDWYQRFFGG